MDTKNFNFNLVKNPVLRISVYILSAILIFAAGFVLSEYLDSKNKQPQFFTQVRDEDDGYKFINPLLECDAAENVFQELKPFKHKLEDFVNETINNGKATHVSIYFRDLNNGPWFGINEKEEFSPASLLKVPVMISYFKQSESDPSILRNTLTLKSNNPTMPDVYQNVKPSHVIDYGKPYTVDELIYRMIVYSDNRAQHLLITSMDMGTFSKLYDDFGLQLPSQQNPDTQVTVKSYAAFFRMLYNASYLNKNDSEKALEILSQSEYKDGLVRGALKGTVIAHKFGERQVGDGQQQLHDCGIIYYPKHPYLLCVMTRGSLSSNLSDVISQASLLVYQEIDSQGDQ